MLLDADIFRIRCWEEHILVGPRGAFGFQHGLRPKSSQDIRSSLAREFANNGALHELRHFARHWNICQDGSNVPDKRLIDLTVSAVEMGRICAYGFTHTPDLTTLVPDERLTAVRLREAAASIFGALPAIPDMDRPSMTPLGDDRLSAKLRTATPREIRRIDAWPLEARIAEIVERVAVSAGADAGNILKPEALALVVAVLAVWARHEKGESLALSALLLSERNFLRAQWAFAAAAAITKGLRLTSSAVFEHDLDDAAAPLINVVGTLGSQGFLAVIGLGARRLSMPAAKQSLRVRDYQTRPPPRPSNAPQPQPASPKPPKPGSPPPASISRECLDARIERDAWERTNIDAQLASAAYSEGATPAEVPGYTPIVDEDGLAKAGLEPQDLKLEGTNFRAVVYQNNEDKSYVVSFRGTQKWKDWENNIAQGMNLKSAHAPTSYYVQAQNIANSMSNEAEANGLPPPRFIGHSLGGGLASAAARATGSNATTFNAAGLHSKTVDKELPGGHIKAVYVKGEALTSVQNFLPIPKAASNSIIALDPPPNLAQNLLPALGQILRSLGQPIAAMASVAAGIAIRSIELHGMDSVHASLKKPLKDAEGRVKKLCPP